MQAAHDPRYLEFVARLRQARKDRGVTQTRLADLLGKPQPYVSKVETCERRIDVIEAAEWCICLDTCIDDVLPGNLRSALASYSKTTSDGTGAA